MPRTYVGNTGDDMSSDIPKMEVLLIRRGEELLPPSELLNKDDRIIVYYYSNFDMKRTNRIVTELPLKTKKKKIDKKEESVDQPATEDQESTTKEGNVGYTYSWKESTNEEDTQ